MRKTTLLREEICPEICEIERERRSRGFDAGFKKNKCPRNKKPPKFKVKSYFKSQTKFGNVPMGEEGAFCHLNINIF